MQPYIKKTNHRTEYRQRSAIVRFFANAGGTYLVFALFAAIMTIAYSTPESARVANIFAASHPHDILTSTISDAITTAGLCDSDPGLCDSSTSSSSTSTSTTGTTTSTTGSSTSTTGTLPPDFDLSNTPAAINISEGATSDELVDVIPLNGFVGTVTSTITGLPAGVSYTVGTISPTSMVYELSAAIDAPLVLTPVTVTVTVKSGILVHSTTFTITVDPPAPFSLTASRNSISVAQGASESLTLTGSRDVPFNVVLSANTALPTGVTLTRTPRVYNGGTFTETVTFTASATAPVTSAPVPVTFTRSADGDTERVIVDLSVTAATSPTFSLTASPTSVALARGGTATSTITIASANGAVVPSDVVLTATNLAPGLTASFSPLASGTSTLTLTANTGAEATVSAVEIIASSTNANESHDAILSANVTANDNVEFSVIAVPQDIQIMQTQTGTTQVFLSSNTVYPASAVLSVSGLPAGVTANISPTSVDEFSSSTISFTTTADTPATNGFVPIEITATDGALVRSAYVRLSITLQPSFALTATGNTPSTDTPALTVASGSSAVAQINITDIAGFTNRVSLSATGLPSGVTGTFGLNPTYNSTTFTLTADQTVQPTTTPIPIIVTGISGSITKTTTFNLVVVRSGFTLHATPQSLTVLQGSTGTTTVSVSRIPGFTDPVTLTVTGLPTTVTSQVTTNPVTDSTVIVFTASATAPVAQTPIIVAITGNGGGSSDATGIALQIAAPPPTIASLTLNPTTVSGGALSTGQITLNGIAGFTPLSVTVKSADPSVTVPNVVLMSPGSSTVSFPITTTAVATQRNVSISAYLTGKDGIVENATLTVNPVAGLSVPAGLNLISIPYDYSGVTPATLFGLPELKIAAYDSSALQYAVSPTAPADTLHIGRGYWIRLAKSANVQIVGTPADITQDYIIGLQPGWNLIGNPFVVDRPFANFEVSAGGHVYTLDQAADYSIHLLDKNMWYYDPTASSGTGAYELLTTEGSMMTGKGYWIHANAAMGLIIPKP